MACAEGRPVQTFHRSHVAQLSEVPVAVCAEQELAKFLDAHHRVFVLTGAGCSSASGIPEYRDDQGNWKHRQPMTFQRFVSDETMRRRYWAGSAIGYGRVRNAKPNAAHLALASLERDCWIRSLVTQNVDCLHRKAGSAAVVELHGRLDQVVCMVCGQLTGRDELQSALRERNPDFNPWAAPAPDGDARVLEEQAAHFDVPPCARCGGMLKPDVVFFGESVPRSVVATGLQNLAAADAMLVVGSSLMVYSGFRFVKLAAERGLPIAIVNRGKTRADELATLKLACDCEGILPRVVSLLRA